jgi:hypothetical protein
MLRILLAHVIDCDLRLRGIRKCMLRAGDLFFVSSTPPDTLFGLNFF